MDDHEERIREDMAELREHLETYDVDDLCYILEEYIELVSSEGIIGMKEYQAYIDLLTEEIDKKKYD